uniref:Saposin B-type domain-containing protein n=1 Tax=Strongyloides venezuelensis TaxID=75913 RepID=A0A0K0FBJ9_STRVS
MKYILPTILLASFVVLSASLQPESRGLLCSACKFLWKEVKKELPVVADYEEKELKAAVTNVCSKFTFSIPLLGQLCDNIGDDVITDVYKFILQEDKEINPDKICTHLNEC